MADLIRTQCGRIGRTKMYMLNAETLTPYYEICYKSLFSPFVRETCDFVQKSMGYHSEMVAFSKLPNFVRKMKDETKIERQFR